MQKCRLDISAIHVTQASRNGNGFKNCHDEWKLEWARCFRAAGLVVKVEKKGDWEAIVALLEAPPEMRPERCAHRAAPGRTRRVHT